MLTRGSYLGGIQMIFNVGAGGNNAVYLTQAEYDALPDSKLSNGVEYRITDANVGESIASNLAYDNTYSGINAVNVQTAIDEVSDSLKFLPDYENAINLFSGDIKSSTTYTAPSNGIVLVRWYVNSNDNTCNALINGVYVGTYSGTSWIVNPIFVKKGDVITFNIVNATISGDSKFVPFI